jgi:hypothetical protein
VEDVHLQEFLNSPEEICEIRIGIAASYLIGLVGIYFQRGLFIQEIIQEMLNKLFPNHIVYLRQSFFGKFKPKLEILPELSPTFRYCSGN